MASDDQNSPEQQQSPSQYIDEYAHPLILEAGGPLVPCEWSVPRVLASHLVSAGRPVPAPVLGQLLLDTGASRTCIGQSAVRELGLNPLRLQPGFGAGGRHELAVYRVRMTIRLANETSVTEIHWESEAEEIPSLEESVAPLGLMHSGQPARLVGLLGRDILRHTRFLYDGIDGRIEVKFDLDSLNRFSERGRVVVR